MRHPPPFADRARRSSLPETALPVSTLPPALRAPQITRLLALLLCAVAACAASPIKGVMVQINRTYLDMREHLDEEDLAAVAADGARMEDLVATLRPLNDDATYQEQTDALAALAERLTAAGRSGALADARAAFLELNRPCAACHRVYRVRAAVD